MGGLFVALMAIALEQNAFFFGGEYVSLNFLEDFFPVLWSNPNLLVGSVYCYLDPFVGKLPFLLMKSPPHLLPFHAG